MLKGIFVGLMWSVSIFAVVFFSEQIAFFDKTQWCLLVIVYWLISISYDINVTGE